VFTSCAVPVDSVVDGSDEHARGGRGVRADRRVADGLEVDPADLDRGLVRDRVRRAVIDERERRKCLGGDAL
jgi:hypothetical protein